MSQKNIPNARLIIGIVLISIGGLFLLENFEIFNFDFGYYLSDYIFRWQSILLIIGAIIIISSENKSPGLVLLTIGIIGFLPMLWPLILVGVGLYILYKRKNSETSGENIDSENSINDVSIFGGGKKIINSQSFKGGNITSIFGGSEIDLRDAKLAEGEQIIDMVAIFGGNTIIVPAEWNVKIDVVPIFGGVSDNRRRVSNGTSETSSNQLIFRGTVIFGGAEIKD